VASLGGRRRDRRVADVGTGSFPETRRFWANLGQAERAALDDTILEPVCLFAESEFFRRPLPFESLPEDEFPERRLVAELLASRPTVQSFRRGLG
jgi:hypothetical protein